jgi:hypothetical protein
VNKHPDFIVSIDRVRDATAFYLPGVGEAWLRIAIYLTQVPCHISRDA